MLSLAPEGSCGQQRAVLDLTNLFWAIWAELGSENCCGPYWKDVLDLTGLNSVLAQQDKNRLQWTELDLTGLLWDVQNWFWAVVDCTWPYWTIPNCSGLMWCAKDLVKLYRAVEDQAWVILIGLVFGLDRMFIVWSFPIWSVTLDSPDLCCCSQ